VLIIAVLKSQKNIKSKKAWSKRFYFKKFDINLKKKFVFNQKKSSLTNFFFLNYFM
jgi:hypothetical protein